MTAGPVAPTPGAAGRLWPLPLGAGRITGGFWAARQRVNREVVIPEGHRHLEAAGNLDNLRIAAGTAAGTPRGPVFMDSDVYKWLEAVAWDHGREPAPELLAAQREVTAVVAAAQQPDGYLDSEHYCAGHLVQAAVAQVRATGDRGLLDVAVRLADHLVATFGGGGRPEVDGHPVVETALVELYRETGTRAYLELARAFVDARGHGLLAGSGQEPTYFSDRVPVREQSTVEGHAVRAVYLAAGATDVAVETGDTGLLAALETQFAHMLATKTYVTGGLRARGDRESFGDPYELPPDLAYAESCAAVGGVHWAWRMLLATGDPRYADAAERMLLNALLPGISLGGSDYFYVNPLPLRPDALADDDRSPAHGRRGWFECACCPANLMRMLASLGGYLVRGCLAVERGPLVYAVDQVDQAGAGIDDLVLDPAGRAETGHRPDLLGGVTVVRLPGWSLRPEPPGGGDPAAPARTPVSITAVPYFAWANRGVGPMRVWLPAG